MKKMIEIAMIVSFILCCLSVFTGVITIIIYLYRTGNWPWFTAITTFVIFIISMFLYDEMGYFTKDKEK